MADHPFFLYFDDAEWRGPAPANRRSIASQGHSMSASVTGWQQLTGSGFPGKPVAPPAPQRVCFARHLRGLAPGQLTPTCQSRLGHQHQDRQAFCDDVQNVIRKPATALFLLAEFLGDDEVRPVDERAPQRRASVGECGRIERAASAVRPRAAGLIYRDAIAGGEVNTVDVCAAALIVERNFLHHATEAAAAVRQFPSEVGQRLTIVLVVSKDDCGGLNFRFGAHDNVRCSNHEMVSRERLGD